MAAFHKRRLTNFLQEIVHLPANRKITALQRLSFEFQNINDFATIICESEEVVKVLIDTVLESDQESILPNFHFSGFPIFGVKLESL